MLSERFEVREGDALELLAGLEPESVDAVITDPPYGIRKGGDAWDSEEIEGEFQHDHKRLVAAERRGEIGRAGRKTSGFANRSTSAGNYDFTPAGMRAFQEWSRAWSELALAALKPGGHLVSFSSQRTYHRMASGVEDAGFEIRGSVVWIYAQGFPKSRTTLKPAHEPAVLARKKIRGTLRKNVERYGVGEINIDAGRTGAEGAWPSNVVVSHHPDCRGFGDAVLPGLCHEDCPALAAAERGFSPRVFYSPKVPPNERIAGAMENLHPTVMPTRLMRWLIRLAIPVPEDALVLDPFNGAATTGCAALVERARYIGFERDPEWVTLSRGRLADWAFAYPLAGDDGSR